MKKQYLFLLITTLGITSHVHCYRFTKADQIKQKQDMIDIIENKIQNQNLARDRITSLMNQREKLIGEIKTLGARPRYIPAEGLTKATPVPRRIREPEPAIPYVGRPFPGVKYVSQAPARKKVRRRPGVLEREEAKQASREKLEKRLEERNKEIIRRVQHKLYKLGPKDISEIEWAEAQKASAALPSFNRDMKIMLKMPLEDILEAAYAIDTIYKKLVLSKEKDISKKEWRLAKDMLGKMYTYKPYYDPNFKNILRYKLRSAISRAKRIDRLYEELQNKKVRLTSKTYRKFILKLKSALDNLSPYKRNLRTFVEGLLEEIDEAMQKKEPQLQQQKELPQAGLRKPLALRPRRN